MCKRAGVEGLRVGGAPNGRRKGEFWLELLSFPLARVSFYG